jgi:hypothetical protein
MRSKPRHERQPLDRGGMCAIAASVDWLAWRGWMGVVAAITTVCTICLSRPGPPAVCCPARALRERASGRRSRCGRALPFIGLRRMVVNGPALQHMLSGAQETQSDEPEMSAAKKGRPRSPANAQPPVISVCFAARHLSRRSNGHGPLVAGPCMSHTACRQKLTPRHLRDGALAICFPLPEHSAIIRAGL